ncbi:MAG TPA: NAD(P)/FAD-dependent oxidoreductase [Opitutaceae bacterium]|nr:NAD(P)/FAD-dependent oxidoreductase [Opitutaceae bacterium]
MENAEQTEVLVIGAGVAGLIAARDLASGGLRVVLLEARGRIGGRMLTRRPIGDPSVELGPEFVHGENPVLTGLVKESGIQLVDSPAKQWVVSDRGMQSRDDLWDRLAEVMKRIDAQEFSSFGAWLKNGATSIVPEDRVQAREFVQNFHAGSVDSVSAKILKETTGGTEDEQQRVNNGYDRIPLTLAEQAYAAGVAIELNSVVKTIRWEPGAATVEAATGGGFEKKIYRAKAVVITLPLGVLKAVPGQLGAIAFEPELTEKRTLWELLPFGFVTRITLRFRDSFWNEPFVPPPMRKASGKDFGFLHAPGAPVPVWWSSSPAPVLIGWAGGPASRALAGRTTEDMVQAGLRSLADALGCSFPALREALVESYQHDWSADPFCRGGYSFAVAGLEDAPSRLAEAVENTLFFAGEATAEPAELGTVGGALDSGVRVAKEVLRAVRTDAQKISAPNPSNDGASGTK